MNSDTINDVQTIAGDGGTMLAGACILPKIKLPKIWEVFVALRGGI